MTVVLLNTYSTFGAGGGGDPDPDPGDVLFSREMIGTGAASGTIYVFAQQFAPGTVPSGDSVVCQVSGSAIRTQFEVHTTWPDGSAWDALMAVELPSLADGATADLDFTIGTHPSPGSDLDLEDELTGRSAGVTITPDTGSAWSYDFVANLPAGRRRSGPLVAEAAYEVAIPSANFQTSTAGGVRAYLWATKSGGLFLDIFIGNHRFIPGIDSGAVTVAFAAEVEIDAATVLSVTADAMPRNSGGCIRLLGDDPDPVFLRPAVDEMHAAGICARYDQTLGVSSSLLTTIQARLAHADWQKWTSDGTTTPLRYLIHANPTGDDEGLYAMPFDNASAAWMCGGHQDFYRYAVGRAEGLGANAQWIWDRTYSRWPNSDDRPGVRIALDTIATVETFYDDRAHHPLAAELPALLTGRGLLRDCVLTYAHAEAMDGYNTQGSSPPMRTWSEPSRQLRTAGITMAVMSVARIFADGHAEVSSGFLDRNVIANLAWKAGYDATFEARYGEIYGFWPHVSLDPADIVPWMDGNVTSALCLLALQGITEARDTLEWRSNFVWGGWLQTGTRWPLNMVAYGIPLGGTGTEHNTWAELITAAESGVANQTALEKDDMYCRVMRMTLAMQAYVFPSDTTLQAAITAFDAIGYRGFDDTFLRDEPKHNVLRPAGYAVPDP